MGVRVLRDCNAGSHNRGAGYTGVFILGDSGEVSLTLLNKQTRGRG